MSTGKAHTHSSGENRDGQLTRLLERPDVARGLAIGFSVDRDHDIPYVGGVSQDGRTVYVDRHFPRRVAIAGRMIDVTPGLIRHEQVEGVLLRLSYKNPAAHEFATAAENRIYRAMGLDPREVEAVYPKYIKAARVEELIKVPGDLDLRPYSDAPEDTRLLGNASV